VGASGLPIGPRMARPTERNIRPSSLVWRLAAGIGAGALLFAVCAGWLAAGCKTHEAAAASAARDRVAAVALAARAAPLLQSRDLMRLSVLAAVAGDPQEDRVLLLDATGEVVIDTALALGGSTLPLLAAEGVIQRHVDTAGAAALRETAAPVRFDGAIAGEVRLLREPVRSLAAFDWAWFGFALAAGLALAALAAWLASAWSGRARRATDALVRLASGEAPGGLCEDADEEFRGFGAALRELEQVVATGLEQVRAAYLEMAQAVVEGLEQRQLVPPGRGERTAQLAARLADRMQLGASERDDVLAAGRLVDLGKASLRPTLLQQQAPLDADDWASLERHPVYAAEQLERVPALSGVAACLRHQLERYDGRGGPDGLRADRIPLGARLLAVASAYDALTTGGAMGSREALEKLVGAKGEVFDPLLVDRLCEELQEHPPEEVAARDAAAFGVAAWRELEPDPDGEEFACADTDAELEVVPEAAVSQGQQP